MSGYRVSTRSSGTQLFHCAAGKDRTGWTAAPLLSTLHQIRSTRTQDGADEIFAQAIL
ncbi:tyrosine-protein phosphatase [Rhodococcus opacus]|nr:tyrosine-protein phosphatase [Rhodococcus opacus]